MTDRFRQYGAVKGNVGYVIEVYDNGDCEVEFSDESGTSFAQIVAAKDELMSAELDPLVPSGLNITTVESTSVSKSDPDKSKTKVSPFTIR